MLNSIKLALRDVWRDKWKMVFYILFIASASYVLISVTASLIRENRYSGGANKNYVTFNEYVVSHDKSNLSEVLDNLERIYDDEAITYFMNNNIRNEILFYYIIGDVGFLPDEFQESEGITCYGNRRLCSEENQIDIGGTTYPVRQISAKSENNSYFMQSTEEKVAYVLIPDLSMLDTLGFSPERIFLDIVINTRINSANKALIEDFTEIVNQSYMTVKVRATGMSERGFIIWYMYPLLAAVLMVGILLGTTILEGSVQKRKKEFTLHLLHGSTLQELYLRQGIYFLIVLIGAASLLLLCMTMNEVVIFLMILVYVAIWLILMTCFRKVITKINLSENFRGDI